MSLAVILIIRNNTERLRLMSEDYSTTDTLELEDVVGAFGPRGGNLNSPRQKPEARRASLNTNGGETLHRSVGFKDTAHCGIEKEMPWHRMAAFMLLAGRTNSEIALGAGVTVAQVSNVRAQRWFQELLATLANEQGEDIRGALQSYALEAVEGIAEIARDTDAGSRVRLSAFTTLLEHANGKPTQTIVSETTHRRGLDVNVEMDEIQTELKRLRGNDLAKGQNGHCVHENETLAIEGSETQQ